MTDRYALNTPTVAAQITMDESFVIHFDRGAYYATERVGSAILAHLEGAPRTEEEIVARLYAIFDEEPATIVEDVARFIAQLLSEEIVRVDTLVPALANDNAPPSEKKPYAAPGLEKHSELEELLQLDPMHDVDEAGWPVAASTETALY